jgi:hypothetical protein
MKQYLYLLLILLFISCKEKKQTTSQIKEDYLSQWFNTNQDSLCTEFTNKVFATAFCKKCDTTWGEMAYEQYDSTSYMGRFSLLAKKYCDSIEVTFFYNKNSTPKTNILLTAPYSKKNAQAIDTILDFINDNKYFQVDKYIQPDTSVGSIGMRGWQFIIKDMRIKTLTTSSTTNLTVSVYKKWIKNEFTPDYYDALKKELFGEDLLSKKINQIDFVFSDSINNDLPTVYETLINLKQ